MKEENKRKEKTCLFFASDYHFEMISLPYINEKLKENKKVIIMTENNLDNSVYKVLTNVDLKPEEKEKIIEIDWKNNDLNKFKEIKKASIDGKETLIFIKGNENYIENINKNIENWIKEEEVNIIDCYNINDIQENMNNISKKYNTVLSTIGKSKIN